MTGRQLHELLYDLHDTREVVVSDPTAGDVALAVWRAAAAEAQAAYDEWDRARGAETYAAYRAAADRADAAVDALVA